MHKTEGSLIENQKMDPVFLEDNRYIAHVEPETGKTQSLAAHLNGVMYLAERNCPLDILRNIVKVAALLHDAGKTNADFLAYMEDVLQYGEKARKRSIDHASAGARIIEDIAGGTMVSELVGIAVYSHHGLQDCIDMESGETLSEKRRKKDIDFESIKGNYFSVVDRRSFIEYLKKAHMDVQKLNVLISDHMGGMKSSGETDSEKSQYGNKAFYWGMFERLILSVLIDSDWTDTACFFQEEELPERLSDEKTRNIWSDAIVHFNDFMDRLLQKGGGSPLDVHRNEISDLCFQASKQEKKLYRLTVPTGAGKTFASLRFALNHARKYGKKHIIYVAPYNSILEQNAADIRSAVGNDKIVLEHHCNVFYENEDEESRYRKLTESWDSPLIVTTAVQMLNTLFTSRKSSIRRMYNLCNSVIIFDEVQAFPVRGTELFNLAVNFLTCFCNTTVILCSATQPSLASLDENNLYDCIEMVPEMGKYEEAFKRVEIEDKTGLVPGGMRVEDLSIFALKAFEEYHSVLIIVNTKSCARKVYEELKRGCADMCELYHLSTNMCPENRKDELDFIKKDLQAEKPVICVSTQLVEAGVNLSFGCVIRSLSGLDSIIQAAGRCNRHKKLPMGKVYIIKMAQDAENLDKLEDILRAKEASEKLLYYFNKTPEKYGSTLDSGNAVKAYYRQYFKAFGIVPTKYPCYTYDTTLEDLLGMNKKGRIRYQKQHRSHSKPPKLCQAFREAGDTYQVIPEDGKVTVIVPYDQKAEKAIQVLEEHFSPLSEQKRAVRILQRYSVGISEFLLRKLGGAVHRAGDSDVLVLSMDYYNKKEGVLDAPRNRFLNF